MTRLEAYSYSKDVLRGTGFGARSSKICSSSPVAQKIGLLHNHGRDRLHSARGITSEVARTWEEARLGKSIQAVTMRAHKVFALRSPGTSNSPLADVQDLLLSLHTEPVSPWHRDEARGGQAPDVFQATCGLRTISQHKAGGRCSAKPQMTVVSN